MLETCKFNYVLNKSNKDLSKINGYRLICLLNSLSKVYEKIILKLLNTVIDKSALLDPYQYGFRKYFSTELAVHDVNDDNLLSNIKRKNISIVMSFDIEGAFNNCNRQVIIDTLISNSFSLNIIKLIYNYLSDRKVKWTYQVDTVIVDSNHGVPQGSVLGPVLWNILYSIIHRNMRNLYHTTSNCTVTLMIYYLFIIMYLYPRQS